MSSARTVRIGCGAGFWGDSAAGPAQLVRKGNIDFLVLDYLAEITMSILARMRQKKPESGFATDFVDTVMAPLAKEIAAKKIKVVANAGGVNPRGCADALAKVLEKQGVDLKIAVVLGDDVMAKAPFPGGPDRPLLSANAYLGAAPIAEALRRGADIVITGRCVDSALALGPLMASFDWKPTDYDLLAAGSLAGHVIECGTQATGGVFTDWHLVEKDWSDMGFPIAECSADGSFVLTKPDDTGGLVSPATVAEQIVYEVHDPRAYVLADVVCDFAGVKVEAVGPNRVRVTGAKGQPPTSDYKASLTYADGYRALTTLFIVGFEAAAKGKRVGEAILERVSRLVAEAGLPPFRETSIEVLGAESSFGVHGRADATREVVVKIAAAHDDEKPLQIFAREIAPAATSMAQSISGFAGGRPNVQPIVRLASAFVPKGELSVTVEIAGESAPIAPSSSSGLRPDTPLATVARASTPDPVASHSAPTLSGPFREVSLRIIAHGRSGDKGDTANIGIIARSPALAAVLRDELTAERVQAWLAHVVRGQVTRYDWPGLDAFNFVLTESLGGGGVASLRYDPQGKGLAQTLLELPIRVPEALLK